MGVEWTGRKSVFYLGLHLRLPRDEQEGKESGKWKISGQQHDASQSEAPGSEYMSYTVSSTPYSGQSCLAQQNSARQRQTDGIVWRLHPVLPHYYLRFISGAVKEGTMGTHGVMESHWDCGRGICVHLFSGKCIDACIIVNHPWRLLKFLWLFLCPPLCLPTTSNSWNGFLDVISTNDTSVNLFFYVKGNIKHPMMRVCQIL